MSLFVMLRLSQMGMEEVKRSRSLEEGRRCFQKLTPRPLRSAEVR